MTFALVETALQCFNRGEMRAQTAEPARIDTWRRRIRKTGVALVFLTGSIVAAQQDAAITIVWDPTPTQAVTISGMPAIAYRKNTGEGLDKASMVVEYEAIQKGGSDDGKVKERIITVKEIQSEIPLPGRAGLLRLSGFASRKTILSLYSTTLRKDVMLEGTGAMRFALHRCGAKLSPSNRLSNWISIIIEAARVDEGAVWGVVEFGKRYHGVAYYPEQLMNDIEREVLRHQPTTTVTVACGDGMSVLVQKDVESGDWKAIRLLRLSKPQRMAFKNQQQFLSACAEYYTSSWILENPSGPQFRPDRALESAGAGRWVARTCKTVIDSKGRHEAGLLVVVDDEGSLVELKELNTAP